MDPNSVETSLTMMINSLQEKLEQERKIFLKQSELIKKLNDNLDMAMIRYEIAESVIEEQKKLIDTLRGIITNGYLQNMQ